MTQHTLIEPETRPAPRTRFAAAVSRRPLLSFFVLACLLSWWPAVLYAFGWSPQPIAGFGPFLAALTVLGLTQGRHGMAGLLRRMVQWRVPPRAYLFAIGSPLLVSGTAILVNLALGAHADGAEVALWSQIPVTFLIVLLIPGIGGPWEEPGFRGFALERLEERFGLNAAPLVLGVFWVFWHLPLFLTGMILATDVATVLAASVVIAVIFHLGQESVLIAMVWHATNNAVGGSYASQIFGGGDNLRLGVITATGWWVLAAAVLLAQRLRSRSGSRR